MAKGTQIHLHQPHQACPTITPLLESASMLPTINSHIPLVIKSGKQATRLAQF
jgi:hypothetical protein